MQLTRKLTSNEEQRIRQAVKFMADSLSTPVYPLKEPFAWAIPTRRGAQLVATENGVRYRDCEGNMKDLAAAESYTGLQSLVTEHWPKFLTAFEEEVKQEKSNENALRDLVKNIDKMTERGRRIVRPPTM